MTTYSIEGMTCESCVNHITAKISALPGVKSAKVSLGKKKVEIEADRAIHLNEVKKALADSPKYSVFESKTDPLPSEKSLLTTYRPLFTVVGFIFLVSLAEQVNLGSFQFHLFMNHLMAGFFIGFSFFKFLDLKAFAESFMGYDPIAKQWSGYGYLYPFIELSLGLLFVAGIALPVANTLTICILAPTTFGVYKKLQNKSAFQCACLGTTFNLPLSNITILENVVMMGMALAGLFFHLE